MEECNCKEPVTDEDDRCIICLNVCNREEATKIIVRPGGEVTLI